MKDEKGNLFESRVGFPTTDWSLIRDAQAMPTKDRAELLGVIVRQYWKPLYAFYRSQGLTVADAEDSVQGFFASVVEGGKIAQVSQGKGRFRDWLITCARNHLRDRIRRDHAQKRRPEHGVLSFEELRRRDGDPFEPMGECSPEKAFTEAWRRELLRRALDLVLLVCKQQQRQTDYGLFSEYYMCTTPDKPTWKQLAQRHQVADWKQAARKADWVKGQLSKALRQLVREYVDGDDEVDYELRSLLHS